MLLTIRTVIQTTLVALTFAFNSHAQQDDGTSQQVYDAMRLAESMYDMETANDECPKNNRSGFWGLCVTENSKNESRLREVLRSRANSGDPTASFYWGVMLSEGAARHRSTEIGMKARKQGFELAISYFKPACTGGISDACWNIADIYLKGLGQTKSELAAVEWFYRAGVGYLANSKREEALATLEAIQKISGKHPLGEKLKAKLAEGTPK
jgi:TPR repeat protein